MTKTVRSSSTTWFAFKTSTVPSRQRVAAAYCVLLLTLAADTLAAQGRGLGPVSLSSSAALQESFVRFRSELRSAADSCDVGQLERLLAPKVKAGYETTDRGPILTQICDGGEPWRALRDALDQDVSRVGDSLVAPSAYSLGDEDDTTGIVVGRDVRIRAKPSTSAPVLGLASLERVELVATHRFEHSLFDDADEPDSAAAWALVTTSTGVTGYVYGRFLYTVAKTRFVFELVGGRWALVSWAAGAG